MSQHPEEIPLTSMRTTTTSDDTDQDDSPYRRPPIFDTNERRRVDAGKQSKWYARHTLLYFYTSAVTADYSHPSTHCFVI